MDTKKIVLIAAGLVVAYIVYRKFFAKPKSAKIGPIAIPTPTPASSATVAAGLEGSGQV
jgi:hypothetical protein